MSADSRAKIAFLPTHRHRRSSKAALDGLLSVVVVVDREEPRLGDQHARLREAVAPLAAALEVLYVLDGPLPRTRALLEELQRQGEPVVVLAFPRVFGRAAALSVAFREARGDWVLTLPLLPEPVDLAGLSRLVPALERADLVVGVREPRRGGGRFERLVGWLVGDRFTDLRSDIRLMRREVAESLVLYGNQHRFLPLVAQTQGFLVEEVPVGLPHPEPPRRGPDLALLLDLLTVFFLVKFVQKPFRFFGGVGFAILALGGLGTAWLVWQRLVEGIPLADRPALVLTSLLVVLGLQIVAIGLVGEIIAFANARTLHHGHIERVVEAEGEPPPSR